MAAKKQLAKSIAKNIGKTVATNTYSQTGLWRKKIAKSLGGQFLKPKRPPLYAYYDGTSPTSP